jgi:hypothetical protein
MTRRTTRIDPGSKSRTGILGNPTAEADHLTTRVHRVLQADLSTNGVGDYGGRLIAGLALSATTPVRIIIDEDADPGDVVDVLLRQIAKWLRGDGLAKDLERALAYADAEAEVAR